MKAGTLRKINHTPMRDLLRGRLTGRLDLDRLMVGFGIDDIDRDDNGGTFPDDEATNHRRGAYPSHVARWLTDEQYQQQRETLPNGDWVIWPVAQ